MRSGQPKIPVSFALAALSAAVLAGCAKPPAENPWAAAAPTVGQGGTPLVFESELVQADPNRGLDFQRFEFSRSDAEVNMLYPVPQLATNAWPQPLRPLERRIRFSDWVQR